MSDIDQHEQEQYQRTIHTMRQARQLERVLIFVTVVITIIANLFSMYSVARLNDITNRNQQTTIEARKANATRQQELQNYIKCVLLIRYDVPPEALQTRKGVETALDNCAGKNR